MRHAGFLVFAVACSTSVQTPISSTVDLVGASTQARAADAELAELMKPNYRRPLSGSDIHYASMRVRYLDACKAGDTRSCWMVSQLRDPFGKARDPSADELVAEHCRANDLMSCRALPATNESRAKIAKWPGWAGRADACYADAACKAELERECDQGFPASCQRFAQITEHGEAFDVRAAQLAVDGCRQGLVDECEIVKAESSVLPAATMVIAYRVRCSVLQEDCGDLADSLKDHPIERRDVMEHACQFSPADSRRNDCADLVKAYAAHAFPEPVPNRFAELRDWYCIAPVFFPAEVCDGARNR